MTGRAMAEKSTGSSKLAFGGQAPHPQKEHSNKDERNNAIFSFESKIQFIEKLLQQKKGAVKEIRSRIQAGKGIRIESRDLFFEVEVLSAALVRIEASVGHDSNKRPRTEHDAGNEAPPASKLSKLEPDLSPVRRQQSQSPVASCQGFREAPEQKDQAPATRLASAPVAHSGKLAEPGIAKEVRKDATAAPSEPAAPHDDIYSASTPCRSPRHSPRTAAKTAPSATDPSALPSLARSQESSHAPAPKKHSLLRRQPRMTSSIEERRQFADEIADRPRPRDHSSEADTATQAAKAEERRKFAAELAYRPRPRCQSPELDTPAQTPDAEDRPHLKAEERKQFAEKLAYKERPRGHSPDVDTPGQSAGAEEKQPSVREMKEQLTSHGVDFSSCVEKSDLQDLWKRFDSLAQQPVEELRARLASFGGSVSSVPPPSTASGLAARLLGAACRRPAQEAADQSPHGSAVRGMPAPTASSSSARPSPVASAQESISRQDSTNSLCGNPLEREQEAAREVRRIESLKRERFCSTSSWGFSVLGVSDVSSRDLPTVQKSYRGLMKKLHPDKVQQTSAVSKVLDILKEAKDACERSLSRQLAPSTPRKLAFTTLCSQHGRRRYRLNWAPPCERESAPVRRYIVAAFDPAYGKALTISVLEPDYSKELRRFVSVEELGAFVLAEEELQKMPALWKQSTATIQVAAANDVGQSSWAVLQVPLIESAPSPSSRQPSASPRLHEWRGPSLGQDGASDGGTKDEELSFAEEIERRLGASDLRTWLDRQRKPMISEYLRKVGVQVEGTKSQLVDRLITWRQTRRRFG